MWRRTDADKYFIEIVQARRTNPVSIDLVRRASIGRIVDRSPWGFHPCGLHININIFNILRDGEREQREA